MPRPAAATGDQIRATVLAMLAEAGDLATLSRALSAIESDVVRAGLADIAIPGIPPDIAEQIRAPWQAAVTVQLDNAVRLKAEAQQAVTMAEAARTDAEQRVKLLRQELAELRAQHTLIRERCAALEATLQDRQAQLDAAAACRTVVAGPCVGADHRRVRENGPLAVVRLCQRELRCWNAVTEPSSWR